MATTFYIDASSKGCSSVQPDITGKLIVEVILPDGICILLLMNQIEALINGLAQNPAMQNVTIIKVTLQPIS